MVFPLSLSDLEHVNVISLHRRSPAAPSLSAGAAIPPIPPNLVEKIEAGQFMEMGDLVPTHLVLKR